MIVVPKITVMAHADATLQTAQSMQAKNPTGDALAKITDAITQATNAYNTVSSLNPQSYTGDNKTIFQNARKMLNTARQELNSAWSLMRGR